MTNNNNSNQNLVEQNTEAIEQLTELIGEMVEKKQRKANKAAKTRQLEKQNKESLKDLTHAVKGLAEANGLEMNVSEEYSREGTEKAFSDRLDEQKMDFFVSKKKRPEHRYMESNPYENKSKYY